MWYESLKNSGTIRNLSLFNTLQEVCIERAANKKYKVVLLFKFKDLNFGKKHCQSFLNF